MNEAVFPLIPVLWSSFRILYLHIVLYAFSRLKKWWFLIRRLQMYVSSLINWSLVTFQRSLLCCWVHISKRNICWHPEQHSTGIKTMRESRIITITLTTVRVPVSVQLADKNKAGFNSMHTRYISSTPYTCMTHGLFKHRIVYGGFF